MIIPVSVLLLVTVLLAVLACAIWQLRHTDGEGAAYLNVAALSPPEVYRPIGRLFAPEDAAFVSDLTGHSGPLKNRLRRTRGRIMRLYLRQIRSDFSTLLRLARVIAPYNANPDFAVLLARQCCVFYLLLSLARFRGLFGWTFLVPLHASALVSTVEGLRSVLLRTVAEHNAGLGVAASHR